MMETNKNIRREKVKLLLSDFYIENGLKVMTEEYLKNRGYCCGNRCRHCPYEPRAQKGSTTLSEKTK